MGIQNVKITKNKIIKTFRSDLTYQRELLIYKMELPYIAKMISNDDIKKIIVLNKECCITLNRLPIKEREKYYKKAKDLFFRFKKDTGLYMYDYHPGNIILDTNNGKLKLIDFEFIGAEKKTHYRKGIQSFLTKIGVMKKSNKKTNKKTRRYKTKNK